MRFRIFIIGLFILNSFVSCENSDRIELAASEISDHSNNESTLLLGETETNQEYNPLDYVRWIHDPEHKLFKSKQIDNIIYSAQYKTPEYIECIESENPNKDTKSDSLSNKNGFSYYFDLKIKIEDFDKELLKYDLNSPEEYDNRVNYLSFKVADDIQLIDGNDTLPCGFLHFERAYDITPEVNLMLVFNTTQKYTNTKTLIFHDKLFNKGIIKFSFDSKDLGRIPKLKYLVVKK